MGLLRFILAAAVVIAHTEEFYGIRLTGGLVAVQIFFIISGFYMTMILSNKYTGRGSYSLFITNRMLKLFPVYWAVVVLTIVFSIVIYMVSGGWGKLSVYQNYHDVMSPGAFCYLILTNIFLFGQDVVMFLGMSDSTGEMYLTSNFRESNPMFYWFLFVPQAWSLGIELTFYLIAPFLVRRGLPFLLIVISISLLARVAAYSKGLNFDPWTYRFFPFEIALFLAGSVSYKLYEIWCESGFIRNRANLFISCGFFLSIIIYQEISIYGEFVNWFVYVFSIIALPGLFQYTRKSKMDSLIGDLSFPIYISHYFVLYFIYPYATSLGLPSELKGEMTMVVSMALSFLLIALIANPVEKLRRARVEKKHSKLERESHSEGKLELF